MIPIEKLVGRIEKEWLTPQTLGEQLFNVFQGFDTQGEPSRQLTFLLRHDLVRPSISGWPVYRLIPPDSATGSTPSWIKTSVPSWETTEVSKHHSSDSPQMFPFDLDNAYEAITVTNTHHIWKYFPKEHDILVTRNMDRNRINTFWYTKGEIPIQPRVMFNMSKILKFFAGDIPEYTHAHIQLWQLHVQEQTYQLQAALHVHDLSLRKFLRVLKTNPLDLLRIELAARE